MLEKANKYRMRNYIVIFIALFLAGCSDYLDLVPDNVATIEMAFNTRASAEKYLATCYSYVPEHAHVEQNFALVGGDDIWYYAERDFYMNNQTSLRLAKGMQNATDPYCNYWDGSRGGFNMYESIRDCNIFLDNIKDIPDLDKDERERWVAEVKTLKAFYHFWLFRMYGPIPVVRENIPVNAETEELFVKREPVDQVVSYIVELLDEVIESQHLPEAIISVSDESGRLTQSAAKAIKAKVLVLAASPLFNGNPEYVNFTDKDGVHLFGAGYDPEKWVKAKDACFEAIIAAESAGHSLYSFTKLLPIGDISDTLRHELTLRATITDPYNEELIWGIGPNWTGDLQRWCQPRWTGDHNARFNDTKKSHAPTLNVVEDFYTNNGLPIKEDKNWDYANRFNAIHVKDELATDHRYFIQDDYTTAKMHLYREPRFYASVGFDGGKWFSLETKNDALIPSLNAKAGQFSGKSGEEIYSITGYFTKKLVNYENIIQQSRTVVEGYVFPIVRLSDLYLMYAETLNEVEGQPTNDVYEYVQRVRDKAGLDIGGDLLTTYSTYSKNPQKPLSKEGMREIIHQERLVELAFEGHRFWDLRRWKLAEDYFAKPIRGWNIYGATPEDFYQVKNIFFRDYLMRDYLWPISQNELIRNSNLVQNPGW